MEGDSQSSHTLLHCRQAGGGGCDARGVVHRSSASDRPSASVAWAGAGAAVASARVGGPGVAAGADDTAPRDADGAAAAVDDCGAGVAAGGPGAAQWMFAGPLGSNFGASRELF